MRENADAKARRLLVEGRLTVVEANADRIRARCRGDSAEMYDVDYSPGGWSCSCPALSRCSHVRALQLVVLVTRTAVRT